MILNCPRCGFRIENLEEKEEISLICPSCKSQWSAKRKKCENYICYIADQPRIFRDFILKNLEELEIESKIFEDGLILRESLKKKTPNLLITNVFLPNVLGVDICEEIKSSISGRNLSVILIGAIHKFDRYHRKPKFLYGADEYIEEGISSDIFKSIVKRLLGIPYDREFIRTPEEEHKLRKMRIFINEIVNEFSEIINNYLEKGDREYLKELFLKANLRLKELKLDLSEDLMKSFLIQYLRTKLEEKKYG